MSPRHCRSGSDGGRRGSFEEGSSHHPCQVLVCGRFLEEWERVPFGAGSPALLHKPSVGTGLPLPGSVQAPAVLFALGELEAGTPNGDLQG